MVKSGRGLVAALALACLASSAGARTTPAAGKTAQSGLHLQAERAVARPRPYGHLTWHAAAPTDTTRSRPLVDLHGTDPHFHAKFWLAQSPEGLHVAVDVHDPLHHNGQRDEQLWDGDAVQVGLHPWAPEESVGQGVGEGVAPQDLFLTLALGGDGAAGWVHLAGDANLLGPYAPPLNIEREATSATTRYTTCIPWTLLGIPPGGADGLGVSLWVLDGGNGYAGGVTTKASPRRLRFGASAAGGFRPGEMAFVTLAPPPPPFAALGPQTATLAAGQEGFRLAVRAKAQPASAPLHLKVRCGDWEQALHALPASLHHVLVGRLDPASCPAGKAAELVLADANGEVLAQRQLGFANVVAHVDQATARLEAASRGPQPNAAEDAKTMRAFLQTLKAQAELARPAAPRGEVAGLDALALAVARGYADPAARAEAQAGGNLPYLQSFVAADDQTLQPYKLHLPRHHTPEVPQPLVVVLHGRGDARLASLLGDVAKAEVRDVTKPGKGLPHAYVLAPWARGNLGAEGLGEADVLAAMAQVQSQHAIDANRIFLVGFSLGGSGAWSLALHRPELWAGVAILSGGTWLTSLGQGLAQNAKHLPFLIWHGTADGAVDVAEGHRMVQELQTAGIVADATFQPGQGHTFSPASWSRVQAFFAGKKRVRPSAWRYTADGPAHRRSRGLALAVDAQRAAFPWVEARLDRGVLHLASQGTAGLELDLGPDGMDLEGEVRVVYQGQEVWRGAAGRLQLGTGAARP